MALTVTPTDPNADSYVSVTEADAYLVDRTDIASWTALTTAQKEQLLRMATRQIDSMRFFHTKMYHQAMDYRLEQALKFPRSNQKSLTGVVDSATTNTIVCDDLVDEINYPNDYWNNGAIVIISGTGKGQVKLITDFVASTGTVTISGEWTTTPDTTSNFRIIKEIPLEVKHATIEQALYIVNGGGKRASLQAEGVTSYTIGDLSETFAGAGGSGEVKLCFEANSLLRGFVSKIGQFV